MYWYRYCSGSFISFNFLYKDLNEAASMGGVLTLQLLRCASCEERQLEVISLLDSAPDQQQLIPLLRQLFPTLPLREQFRLTLLHFLTSAAPDTEAARLAGVFYGKILNRELFPELGGGGGGGGQGPVVEGGVSVQHSSHGPWLAECVRCVSHFVAKENKVGFQLSVFNILERDTSIGTLLSS
jgi:hypothetical protein